VNPLATALATALARAALDGDDAAVRRILEFAADPRALAAAIQPAEAFAEGSRKGRWGMFGKLADWLTGKNESQSKHQPADAPDEVVDAQVLTPKEQFIYDGNTLTLVSSNVHQIRYERGDERANNTWLDVAFKDGSVYRFDDVPFNTVMQMVDSDSPGRFVWRWLREGVPPYKSLYNGRLIGKLDLTKAERKPVVVHVLGKGTKKP
jgi:hypothetical protein